MDYTEHRHDSRGREDFYFALFSDLHADSASFAAREFKADADKALSRGARFLINGDLFDAILPTDHKRYTRANDGFDEDAQINARIDRVYRLLLPYVNSIDFIGIGNHESSIVKYSGADLVAFLVRDLNQARDKSLPPIQRGGYQGFLRLKFSEGKQHTREFVIYREHGKGGAAPVTKGTINIQRLHTTYQADCYWLGHTHTDIIDKTAWSIYPDRAGRIVRKRKLSIITAGYQGCFNQRNLTDGVYYQSSYPEEKFLAPTGMGMATLHIRVPAAHDAPLEVETIN